MTILQGFPMVSELTEITGNEQHSENPGLNCVPASLCAGAMYLNRVTQLGGKYTPDSFKDAVYGQGYIGGMAAFKFVDHCASLGIKLFSLQGPGAQLVQMAHEQVRAGHPVVFTEPNPYGNPNFTHVCVFFGEDTGRLTAMDPFIAQAITRGDAEWATILSDVDPTIPTKEIWIMEELMSEEEDEVVHLDLELNKARVLTAPTIVGGKGWLCLSADFGTATVRVALKHRGSGWEHKDAVEVASTGDHVVICELGKEPYQDVTKISAQVTAVSVPDVVVSLDITPNKPYPTVD